MNLYFKALACVPFGLASWGAYPSLASAPFPKGLNITIAHTIGPKSKDVGTYLNNQVCTGNTMRCGPAGFGVWDLGSQGLD